MNLDKKGLTSINLDRKGLTSTSLDKKRAYLDEFGPKKELRRILIFARHTLTAVCPFLALNLRGIPAFSHRLGTTLFRV